MEDLLIAILQGLFEFALEVLARGGWRMTTIPSGRDFHSCRSRAFTIGPP
jgi:hypothetical protein